MNHEVRPPRRGLLPNLSPDIVNHTARVEVAVFTKAACAVAWKTLSDVSLWPRFCSAYKNVRWQGVPWMPGSRMRLEIGPPVDLVVDRVITVCTPPYHLCWINHVAGYTMEQWISVEPSQDGGSRVATWIEVTGGNPSRDRNQDMRLLQSLVEEWFSGLRKECDRVADRRKDDIRSAAD